jgi:hypothetical protein
LGVLTPFISPQTGRVARCSAFAALMAVVISAQWCCNAYATGAAVSLSKQDLQKECPVRTNTAKFAKPFKTPVGLQPAQQSSQRLINFGTKRVPMVIRHVTVVTDKPLPHSLLPEQINYEATTLPRTGNTLETAEFPEPTFSTPYISHDRRSISFAICLDPTGISAGKYLGTVTVDGPEGLGSASITLTVNAKDPQLFTLSWIVALLGALALLVIKDAANAKKSNNDWCAAFCTPLTNPLWYAATIFTLITTFAALYSIYTNDPAWGSSGFTSLISLVGTATVAVGGHTILTTLGGAKAT